MSEFVTMSEELRDRLGIAEAENVHLRDLVADMLSVMFRKAVHGDWDRGLWLSVKDRVRELHVDFGDMHVPECRECGKGQFRGFPPEGSPEWEVGTVYFWCPIVEHHDFHGVACPEYEPGGARMYDKHGNLMEGRFNGQSEFEGGVEGGGQAGAADES